MKLNLVRENRHEIWVSLGVAILALTLAVVPMGFANTLIVIGCLLVSAVCAINAALDKENMSVAGLYFTGAWLLVILGVTA